MTIDLIIYICIYICVTVVVFDLIFSLSVWNCNRREPKRIRLITQKINDYIKLQEQEQVKQMKLQYKWLYNHIRHMNWLLSYSHVFDQIVSDEQTSQNFIQLNNDLMGKLLVNSKGFTNEKKALLAQILSISYKKQEDAHDEIQIRNSANVLLQYVQSDSLYVQANGIKALVHIGVPEYIEQALLFLNENHSRNIGKIFTDYLLKYTGDTKQLIEILLNNLSQYSPHMQVILIDYFRLNEKESYNEQNYTKLLTLLQDDKTNSEVCIALLRFFGKFYYKPAYQTIVNFLEDSQIDVEQYNYAAIAAKALAIYNSTETIELLIKYLHHYDWYVRFNCADSLIILGVDFETILEKNTDKYAEDIFKLRKEVYQLKKRKQVI